MKWYLKIIIPLLIISFVVGMAYREALIREAPLIVRHYQEIMREISSEEYMEKLQDYTYFGGEIDYGTNYYPPRMHYSYILSWLGERLVYTTEDIIRHEDPIEIIEYGKGRCGEFAIAYTALALSQGWNARMVFDVSSGEGNGDHIWTEIWAIPYGGGVTQWLHIDPTEGATWAMNHPEENSIDNPFIDNPLIYERDWEKELTSVWAITPDYMTRVEENYH